MHPGRGQSSSGNGQCGATGHGVRFLMSGHEDSVGADDFFGPVTLPDHKALARGRGSVGVVPRGPTAAVGPGAAVFG